MAYHLTQQQADAEDLVQDVLIKVVNRVDEMQAIDKLGPWLVKVLYHRHIDLFRNRRRAPTEDAEDIDNYDLPLLPTDTNPSHTELVALQNQLNQALLSLPAYQRDIVLMHDVEGYTALELAEILELNVGTVKSRLHRAREKLKSLLDPGTFSDVASCQ